MDSLRTRHVCSLLYLFRINKLFVADVFKHLIIELSSKIFCHREVHIEVVSTVAGSGTRNFALVVTDEERWFGGTCRSFQKGYMVATR